MTDATKPAHEADFSFARDRPFMLTSGGSLQPVTLRYALYGEINPRRDNVILACHALSGSARVADWWPQFFGTGLPFDLGQFCILGVNVLGSCYGSTGPRSTDPRTGRNYGAEFPVISIDDMVHAQARLLDHLDVDRLHAVVGGSIGGMQALAWAVHYPQRVGRCVVIGAAPLNAMGLALSHLQRQAICNDPSWRQGNYTDDDPPRRGLALARALAMCTYKSTALFDERYARRPNRTGEQPHRRLADRFDVGGYLDHQGELFLKRFDANAYLVISKAMDTFELGGNPPCEEESLRRIQARLLLVGISSDWLFPPSDVQALAERIRQAGKDVCYRELQSTHGHDGFLADADQLAPLIADAIHEAVRAVRTL
jgi:homoserine O-acetyltransferase/O-succinyltransferase